MMVTAGIKSAWIGGTKWFKRKWGWRFDHDFTADSYTNWLTGTQLCYEKCAKIYYDMW